MSKSNPKYKTTTSENVSSFFLRPLVEEDRSPQAKRVELLKQQNLSCKSCCNYTPAGMYGKCAAKQNKPVKHYNLCDVYGMEVLK